MKFLTTVVLGIGLLVPGVFAEETEAHARKIEHIHKLIAVTGGEKMADQMFDQVAQTMRASMPGSERFLEDFRKEFDLKRMTDIVIAAYDKNLADEDIEAMLGFYASPAGKRLLEAMPKVMGDMLTGSVEISREIIEKVRAKAESEKAK